MNRLQKKYQEEIVPKLQKEFNIANRMAVVKIEKIVVNVGIGDFAKEKTKQEAAIKAFSQICGQYPQKMMAKKAISEFRLRKGDIVGLRATLRRERMYQFLDKLISIVLPRIRDFQGIKTTAFDQQANYNLGITEQIVFPEVDYDLASGTRGIELAIVTSTKETKQAFRLLELMGLPFEKPKTKN